MAFRHISASHEIVRKALKICRWRAKGEFWGIGSLFAIGAARTRIYFEKKPALGSP
jgi:hypothetical protein